MDLFSENNILSGEEIDSLFDAPETQEEQQQEEKPTEQQTTEEQSEQQTTEVNTEELFDKPESVGSEENNQEKEDTKSEKDDGSSPYILSSIAKAFKEEGILPDLEDSVVEKISNTQDFADAIEAQIQAKFDARQKRIDDALNAGVQPTVVKQYENAIGWLKNITPEALSQENKEAEDIRRRLIYQDYINSGKSKEYAQKMTDRAFTNGTDIEDAKDALLSNTDYFTKQYDDLIEKAKIEEAEKEKDIKKQAESLKKSILDDKEFFGESLTKEKRQKIYDNISKPVYKDPDNEGNYLTEIQNYEREHRADFLKYTSYFFTLTNGYKDFDGLVKSRVNQGVKKGLKNLEATLSNTQRNSDGNINFASGVSSDPEAFFRRFDLDV